MSLSSTLVPSRIVEVKAVAEDCVGVRLRVPDDAREAFRFRPGQFLTVQAELDGEKVRRTYSICSRSGDEDLRIAIKRVPGGRFSDYAQRSLEAGMQLDLLPPQGFFGKQATEGDVVAFAAGSGLTPMLSIADELLSQQPDARFFLFVGNRTQRHILLREELEELKDRYPDRFACFHILSREATLVDWQNGRVDGKLIRETLPRVVRTATVSRYLVCGPEDMMRDVVDALTGLGVPETKIDIEHFSPTQARPAGIPPKRESDDSAPPSQRLTVRLATVQRAVDHRADSSLLDSLLAKGVDAPYSCRAGMCATCTARVVTGDVRMVNNYALSRDEVRSGLVLTCQAFCASGDVDLDFDT